MQRTPVSNSSSSRYHQRSATFDAADAREYELKRLGNRRSQSQQAANLKHRNGINGTIVNRAERTHDRERSRSDHRIATYACDDTTATLNHAYSGNVANDQSLMSYQQQQQRQQQRREKTFKV